MAAIVARTFPAQSGLGGALGHTSLFSGVLNLPTSSWRHIALRAGVHIWTDGPDDVVDTAGNLLMLISGPQGNNTRRAVRLPSRAAAVYDDSALEPSHERGPAPSPQSPPGRLVCANCSSFVTERPLVTGDVQLYWLVGV